VDTEVLPEKAAQSQLRQRCAAGAGPDPRGVWGDPV